MGEGRDLGAEGRVAIYAAPQPRDPLFTFGSAVIGHDAATGELVRARAPLKLAQERWDELTAEPRRYGFHATLKAPFRLAPGRGIAGLSEALASYGAKKGAPPPFALEVAAIGEFLALVPASPPDGLSGLAADIVAAFDGFRAPLNEAERERRLAAGLTARQRDYLGRYGYPYVLEEFRFHMSLTGKVRDAQLREELRLALAEAHRRETKDAPFSLDALVLFAQAAPGERFTIRERHALNGRPA
jgi:hypothetical protein